MPLLLVSRLTSFAVAVNRSIKMTSRSRIAVILSSAALAFGVAALPAANAATTQTGKHKVAAKHKAKHPVKHVKAAS